MTMYLTHLYDPNQLTGLVLPYENTQAQTPRARDETSPSRAVRYPGMRPPRVSQCGKLLMIRQTEFPIINAMHSKQAPAFGATRTHPITGKTK